jgi:hypothetical protein
MVVDARPGAPKLPGSSSGGCRSAPQLLLSSLLTLARPRHPIRVSGSSDPRSGLLGARLDRFRVRAEPLLGNGDECGVCSVWRVADVCHSVRWLADSLADSESVDFGGIHGSTRFLPLARLRSRALVHSSAVEMSTRAEPGNMAPWPAAADGPFAMWTSRSPTSDQVCQPGITRTAT